MSIRCLMVLSVCLVAQVMPVHALPVESNAAIISFKEDCLKLQSEGNSIIERNCWHKYIALRNMQENIAPDKEWSDIEKRYQELDEKVKATAPLLREVQLEENSDDERSYSAKAEDQIQENQKKSKARKSEKHSFSITLRRSKAEKEKLAGEMVKKAEQAEDHGRLEEALKLFRIARKLDPANASAKTEMARLEKETQ